MKQADFVVFSFMPVFCPLCTNVAAIAWFCIYPLKAVVWEIETTSQKLFSWVWIQSKLIINLGLNSDFILEAICFRIACHVIVTIWSALSGDIYLEIVFKVGLFSWLRIHFVVTPTMFIKVEKTWPELISPCSLFHTAQSTVPCMC